jgi:hypothetical protein
MADRQWFAEGVQQGYETGEEEYLAEGVQLCEDQGGAAAAAPTSVLYGPLVGPLGGPV